MQQFTGTEYLKIDIANCYGLDKWAWSNRISWVDQFEPDLETKDRCAESPILYRKAVRAYRAVQRGEGTRHIMGLDATASGLQIMAALSGCIKTAQATNLVYNGDRADVYQNLANAMSSQLPTTVVRAQIKKPVMTVFYGSTRQPESVFGKGAELAAFYKTLEEQLPGAYQLMGILQSHWRPDVEYHSWTLPDGHVAKVPVTETIEKSLEIDELDHMRFAYRSNILCPKARGRALAANIIHSIDGWIVRMMVAGAAKQGFQLAPIHDCFYASPNYMNQVRANYLTIMRWIANSNLIESILSEISGQYTPYTKHSSNLHAVMATAEYPLS
jgi:DNA-directed RNA polymerase